MLGAVFRFFLSWKEIKKCGDSAGLMTLKLTWGKNKIVIHMEQYFFSM